HRRPVTARTRPCQRSAERGPVADERVADHGGGLGQQGRVAGDVGRVLDLGGGRHRAYAQHRARAAAGSSLPAAAEDLDSAQLGDAAQVDEGGRARAPELPFRQQRVTAREEPGVFVADGRPHTLAHARRPQVVEVGPYHGAPPTVPWPPVARRMAARTRSACRGMSRCVTPSGARASRTALTMAGGDPIAPASPIPLIPKQVNGDGVTVCAVSRRGVYLARGEGDVVQSRGISRPLSSELGPPPPARPRPCAMPPCICPCAISGFIRGPQSSTARNRSIAISPVVTSTSTTATYGPNR